MMLDQSVKSLVSPSPKRRASSRDSDREFYIAFGRLSFGNFSGAMHTETARPPTQACLSLDAYLSVP
jgi:hypothetical protein